MFATLLGPLPRPPVPDDAAAEAVLEAVLAVQAEHGLDPLTDGGWPVRPDAGPVDAWRDATQRADALVKAVISGPFSAGSDGVAERSQLVALADAGCPWIEIHEPAACAIGSDADARNRFAELHRALTADLVGVHLTLAITGGDAARTGVETLLAGAYASLALDLIDGPENWRIAVATPGDHGIIAGVLAAREGSDDGPEVLLWAAGYAASTGDRGAARVGLATSGSYAALPWDVAATKLRRLGEGVRLATAPRDEQLARLDPRAIDPRTAAMGRPPRRGPRNVPG
jgi:hypothetical protein